MNFPPIGVSKEAIGDFTTTQPQSYKLRAMLTVKSRKAKVGEANDSKTRLVSGLKIFEVSGAVNILGLPVVRRSSINFCANQCD